MKTLLLAIVALVAFSAQAQVSGTKVAQSAVPSEVVSAWRAGFPGVAAASWNFIQANDGKAYTAVFTQAGKVHRARYLANGTHRWTSIHHGPNQVPSELATAAKSANAGYTLRWAKQNTDIKKGFTYFKVRMARGATVLTSYFDTNYQPLQKAQIEAQVGDLETETNTEG